MGVSDQIHEMTRSEHTSHFGTQPNSTIPARNKAAKMGETGENSSFFGKHWEGFKGFWGDRFGFLDNYTRFVESDTPLPRWSDSDVEDFIAIDLVHGPALKTAREAVKYGLVGSALGAVSLAGFSWKYSKSPHGAVLALGAGAVCGWTFGHEVANHALQLYRLDTMSAQTKYLEWWESKTAGRS